MATCKDCINYTECNAVLNKYGMKLDPEREICSIFKDRSRFVELPCAEWIVEEDMYGDNVYCCSNCREKYFLEEGTPIENRYFYCPNCGAKFETEQALKEREDNV